MALDSDALVDRRRLKRRLTLWRSLAIIALVVAVVAAIGRFAGLAERSHIARLNVTGVILHDEDRLDALDRLIRDDSVKALIVSIDSPGGTVVGGEALFKTLRRVAEAKPVVAVMGDVAASAGYMTALAADYIAAHEGTITGSVGVIMQTTEISGLLDKIGVSAEAVRSGPLKANPSPFEPMDPAARATTQRMVNDIFQMFLDMARTRRNLSPDRVRLIADGRVFTGRQAVAAGLIDSTGGERAARDWLAREHNVSRQLPVRNIRFDRGVQSWFERLDSLARKTVFSERLTLDGLVSVWHPDGL